MVVVVENRGVKVLALYLTIFLSGVAVVTVKQNKGKDELAFSQHKCVEHLQLKGRALPVSKMLRYQLLLQAILLEHRDPNLAVSSSNSLVGLFN